MIQIRGAFQSPWLKRFVSLAVITVIFGLYVWQFQAAGRGFRWQDYQLDWPFLVVAWLLHSFGLFYGALGWALVMRSMGQSGGLSQSIRIYYITNLTKNLPGSIWHVLGRLYFHQREGLSKRVTTVGVVLELLLTAFGGAVTYLLSLVVASNETVVPIMYPILLLLLCCLLFIPTIFNQLVNKLAFKSPTVEASSVRFSFSAIIWFVSLYFLLVVLGGLILFCFIRAIYPLASANLSATVGAWGLTLMISALLFWIPISLRIRDGILLLSLTAFLPASVAIVITLLWRFAVMANELLWAGLVALIAWMRGEMDLSDAANQLRRKSVEPYETQL